MKQLEAQVGDHTVVVFQGKQVKICISCSTGEEALAGHIVRKDGMIGKRQVVFPADSILRLIPAAKAGEGNDHALATTAQLGFLLSAWPLDCPGLLKGEASKLISRLKSLKGIKDPAAVEESKQIITLAKTGKIEAALKVPHQYRPPAPPPAREDGLIPYKDCFLEVESYRSESLKHKETEIATVRVWADPDKKTLLHTETERVVHNALRRKQPESPVRSAKRSAELWVASQGLRKTQGKRPAPT